MSSAIVRLLWVSMIAGLGMSLARAQVPPASERVLKLPPFIVEGKLRPLKWYYASRPGREVLSVCDAATTEKFMERDWQLEQWLQRLLPERFRVQFSVPEGQILFNEETGRANAREIIAEIARREGAIVDPDGRLITPEIRAGRFARFTRRVQVLPNMRLGDRDVVRVFAVLTDDATEDFVFARDRVAFLLKRRAPALPDWFIEGFVQLYQETRFREDEFEFESMTWTSTELTKALMRDREQPRVLLPMDELFSSPSALAHPDEELGKIWRAEAALFVRWALAAGDAARRDQFWRWLDRLDEAPASEAAFRECFGFGYADARDRLSDFLQEAVAREERQPAQKIGRPPRIAARPATELEIARLRGDWERLQAHYVQVNYPELADEYFVQAHRTLRRAYDRGERDPQLLAIMGLLACDENKAAEGRAYLEESARQGFVRPRAAFELARLRFRECENGDHAHRFTPGETDSILAPLMQAVQAAPPLPEVYVLIAEVWLRSEAAPTERSLAIMAEGVRHYPEMAGLVFAAVQLHVNAGAVTTAQALAERGRLFAPDAKARTSFEEICAKLAVAGGLTEAHD